MRELTLDELKSVELGILKNVAKFDVFMPYDDYQKFVKEYRSDTFLLREYYTNTTF